MLLDSFPRLWFPPLSYYQPDGEFDFARMEQMLTRVYPYCQGVLIPGSTGDGWVQTMEQQEAVVRWFLKGFPFGRFRILLGALMPAAAQTKALLSHWCEVLRQVSGREDPREAMKALGVEAFVICIPKGMTDPADQERALTEVFSTGLPLAFYQLPQVTEAVVGPELILRLAERFPNLRLCKDSGGKDELAASHLLSGRLMLLRGAEGNPVDMIQGEDRIYDGLLLSTVNCFPALYAGLLNGSREYEPYGRVIAEVFAAASVSPISNAFSDSNRAMDHVLYWGKGVLSQPAPLCIGGKPLPGGLIQTAFQAMERHRLVPEKGYGEKQEETDQG